MWNGAFSPNIKKHRDYLHDTYYQHIKDTGRVTTGRVVPVAVNPITEEPFPEDRTYYEAVIILHDGKRYVYLIYSESAGPPSEEEIEEQLERYIRSPLPGGRNIEDYIADIDVTEINSLTAEQSSRSAFNVADIMAA